MQFTKNQAVLDFHFTIFGIIIIALAVCGFIAWTHLGTGLKYKLLDEFGVKTKFLVIDRVDTPWQLAGKEVGTKVGANSRYTFRFTNAENKTLETSVFIDNQISYEDDERTITYSFKKNEIVDGKYLSSRPAIALPLRSLVRIKADWIILRDFFVAIIVLLLITVWRIFEYRKLKAKMKWD